MRDNFCVSYVPAGTCTQDLAKHPPCEENGFTDKEVLSNKGGPAGGTGLIWNFDGQLVCPSMVNRKTWTVKEGRHDSFNISTEYVSNSKQTTVVIKRIDSPDSGWTVWFSFMCCDKNGASTQQPTTQAPIEATPPPAIATTQTVATTAKTCVARDDYCDEQDGEAILANGKTMECCNQCSNEKKINCDQCSHSGKCKKCRTEEQNCFGTGDCCADYGCQLFGDTIGDKIRKCRTCANCNWDLNRNCHILTVDDIGTVGAKTVCPKPQKTQCTEPQPEGKPCGAPEKCCVAGFFCDISTGDHGGICTKKEADMLYLTANWDVDYNDVLTNGAYEILFLRICTRLIETDFDCECINVNRGSIIVLVKGPSSTIKQALAKIIDWSPDYIKDLIQEDRTATTAFPTPAATSKPPTRADEKVEATTAADNTVMMIIILCVAVLVIVLVLVIAFYCCKAKEDKLKIQVRDDGLSKPERKWTATDKDAPLDQLDPEIDEALKFDSNLAKLQTQIIRLIQRAQKVKDKPNKVRAYQEFLYQIDTMKEKLYNRLEDKYKNHMRIKRYKPRLESTWQQAEENNDYFDQPNNTISQDPSVQARIFFEHFDYERNGNMGLDNFVWVCQVVNPQFKMDEINALFEFVKSGAEDRFTDWNLEEFFSSEFHNEVGKFKLDLIKYMSNNSSADTHKKLAKFYEPNSGDRYSSNHQSPSTAHESQYEVQRMNNLPISNDAYSRDSVGAASSNHSGYDFPDNMTEMTSHSYIPQNKETSMSNKLSQFVANNANVEDELINLVDNPQGERSIPSPENQSASNGIEVKRQPEPFPQPVSGLESLVIPGRDRGDSGLSDFSVMTATTVATHLSHDGFTRDLSAFKQDQDDAMANLYSQINQEEHEKTL